MEGVLHPKLYSVPCHPSPSPPPPTPHPPPPPPHYLGFQIIVLFFADTVKKQQEMLDCIWKKTCQCYLSEIIIKLVVNDNFCAKYEGESISNQPIPFPMDQEGHDFRALFQYMFYTWKQNCFNICFIHGSKIAHISSHSLKRYWM